MEQVPYSLEYGMAAFDCWHKEMEREREEEEKERCRKILSLEDRSRQLGVIAVIPDVTDPLVLIEPMSHWDNNFPMSSEEFR
jgi:hypothetical protein